MTNTTRWHAGFALVMLLAALVLGTIAAFAFLFPNMGRALPFEQLRPMHVSAALFWLITAAAAGVMHYTRDVFAVRAPPLLLKLHLLLWGATILVVFIHYALHRFGGREYWEFPPYLCAPLLVAWLLLMAAYFRAWLGRPQDPPLYVWMWSTGMIFFLFTFVEQNLYQVPWFRENYLREITVQWKSNGSMVGAWNQLIYGTALYLMVKLTGEEGMARGPRVFFFWFLGLGNLMFNWGHHIYNVPTAAWIRHVAYGISMAEWLIFISIIRGFKAKMDEGRRFKHLLTYRFLLVSEGWVFLNLFLALLMSVPAINRYTHGTHITVAHAMGATIGINTMILLGSFTYVLRADEGPERGRRWIARGLSVATISLLVFWLALIAAGVLKGYRDVALGIADFQRMMEPVMRTLYLFAFAGIGVLAGLGVVAWALLRAVYRPVIPRDRGASLAG